MLALIRHDRALRGWFLWLLIGATTASAFTGLAMMNAAHRQSAVTGVELLAVAWLAASVYLVFGPVRSRCSSFHLTLPLSARDLWLAHVVTAAAMACAIGLVAVLVQMGHLAPFARVRGSFDPTVPLHLFAGVLLAVVLLQAPAPRLARIPVSAGSLAWTLAVLGGVALLVVALHRVGPAGALVPLALAVAVGAWARARLPLGFTLVPFAATHARPEATPGAEVPARPRPAVPAPGTDRLAVASGIWGGASAGPLDWIGYPLVLLFAFIVGGGMSLLPEDLSPLRYVYIPLASFLLFSAIGPRLARLHHLDPLPIARRVLFAVLIVPYFVAFVGGYGVGALVSDHVARDTDLVGLVSVDGSGRVVVPQRFVRVAWNGEVPPAVAPWGESHAPALTTPLWKGSRARVYSPYSTPEGSSREFVAWQLSRALEAVYGARIPARELGRHLAAGANGVVAADAAGFSPRREYPALRPVGAGPMFPALAVLVCLPWLIFMAALLGLYRAGVSDRGRQAMVWGATGSVLAFLLLFVAAVVANWIEPWIVQWAIEIPVRHLGESALGTLTAWVACAALLAAGYRMAGLRFARMEVPTRPTRFTLIELARVDD